MKTGNLNLQGTLKGQNQNFNTNNLLLNGDFEYWYAGTSSAPDGWALSGGGSVAQESSIVKTGLGDYSIKLISDSNGNELNNSYDASSDWLKKVKDKTLTFSCWVYASDASTARIYIYTGSTLVYSDYHTGDSTWQLLQVTATINTNATDATIALQNTGNTKTVYFDGARVNEGSIAFAYQPHQQDHLYEPQKISIGMGDGCANANTGFLTVCQFSSSYSNPDAQNGWMTFNVNIPTTVSGKTIIIDSFYIDAWTLASGDEISHVLLRQSDGDQSITDILNSNINIGSGGSGEVHTEVLSSSLELPVKPTYIMLLTVGSVSNVRFYSATITYHIKVHA